MEPMINLSAASRLSENMIFPVSQSPCRSAGYGYPSPSGRVATWKIVDRNVARSEPRPEIAGIGVGRQTTDFAAPFPNRFRPASPPAAGESCHRCIGVNARARSVGGPGQPPHIAHRIDGPGTGIKETAMKRAGTDLFRRLLPRQQPDRRAKPDPFRGAPRQILEPR
jgi:hypothetical protein